MDAKITITPYGADFLVRFPKDLGVVAQIKELPKSQRSWSPERTGWIIAAPALEAVCQILERAFAVHISRPAANNAAAHEETRTIRLEYVGACKQREGGKPSAYGLVNNAWAVEFPENVLKKFFGGVIDLNKPQLQSETLYQVLLLPEGCDQQAVKSAYRRLARQWHPDVCRDEGATEMFRTINEAYNVLIDPVQRRKYDAGLHFERMSQSQTPRRRRYNPERFGYRPPLRCGLVTVKGVEKVGRFVVSDILRWEDLRNEMGQVAVATWPKGAETVSIVWV